MAARLGDVIYWAASLIAILIIGFMAYAALFGTGGGNASFAQGMGVVFAIAIWLVGLGCRYVLGGGKPAYYMLPGLKRLDERESWLVRSLKRANRALLEYAFERQRRLMAAAIVAVVMAAVLAALLPRTFLPPFNEGTFTINMALNPGISLAESDRLGRIAERLVLDIPEVRAVGRRTGRAELDEHAEGVHSSDLEIDLKQGGRGKDAIVADLRARLSVLPVSLNIGQPISHRLDHVLSGVRAQIVVKFFGEDLDALRSVAEIARARLAESMASPISKSRSKSASRNWRSWSTTPEPPSMACSRQAITEQLERLSNGRVVSRLFDGSRRFDIVLRLSDSQRTNNGLGDLVLETPYGWVPVRHIAEVKEGDGPNQILRENGKRRMVVLANARRLGQHGATSSPRSAASLRP